MDTTLQIRGDSLDKLAAACHEAGRNLNRELRIVISKASKRTEKHISRRIRKRLNVDKKDILSHIVAHRAKAKENSSIPAAVVIVKHDKRLPLKRFNKTRQIQAGVSYKIDKAKPRRLARSAFGPNIARLGHHVFQREGKSRLPIKKHPPGLSAWGMFTRNLMDKETELDASMFIETEMERRTKFILLKHFGKI